MKGNNYSGPRRLFKKESPAELKDASGDVITKERAEAAFRRSGHTFQSSKPGWFRCVWCSFEHDGGYGHNPPPPGDTCPPGAVGG